MNNKICQQCGRELSIENFKPYRSRSKGIRNTNTSRNTLCTECSNFNANMSRIWKIPVDQQTEHQKHLLEIAKDLYFELAKRGLKPKGAYCSHVLGTDEARTDTTESFVDSLMHPIKADDAVARQLQGMLTMDLTDEPYVYEDMLDEVDCNDSFNHCLPQYLDLYNEVANRIEKYGRAYDET